MRSHRLRVPGEQDGQALIEFALVIPVLFLVLIGLFDVGRLVFINNEIAEAAREAARWGSVQDRAATAPLDVEAKVRDHIAIAPTPVVALECANPSAGPTASECRSGNVMTISVETSVQPITPIIGSLIGPLVLQSSAQMTIH